MVYKRQSKVHPGKAILSLKFVFGIISTVDVCVVFAEAAPLDGGQASVVTRPAVLCVGSGACCATPHLPSGHLISTCSSAEQWTTVRRSRKDVGESDGRDGWCQQNPMNVLLARKEASVRKARVARCMDAGPSLDKSVPMRSMTCSGKVECQTGIKAPALG